MANGPHKPSVERVKASVLTRDQTIYAPVWNEAGVLSNKRVLNAGKERALVARSLEQCNHSVLSSENMSGAEILYALRDWTVFFMCTHANAEVFGDCFYYDTYTPLGHLGEVVSADQVGPEVDAKSALLPDGTWCQWSPSYNLVMLQGCNSAGYSGNLSYNFYNAFRMNELMGDKLFIGWDELINTGYGNVTWIGNFWNNLAAGDSVLFAAIKSNLVGDFVGGQPRHHLFPTFQSDTRTKIHGLYKSRGLTWARFKDAQA